MTATTWSKFFWSDWESDETLKMCSPGAQALWMRMLCICAKTGGYLMIGGEKLGAADMAIQTGWPLKDVKAWWAELQKWGVFSVEGRGKIYCRRMVKDARRSAIGQETGARGGNPSLGNNKVKSDTLKGEANGRSGRLPSATSHTPKSPEGTSVNLEEWKGPLDVLMAVAGAKGEAWALTYLRHCRHQDLPHRALITNSATVAAMLRREVEGEMRAIGVRIVVEEAA